MDLELRHKRALVTGGSRGIGKAIARELALEGASVALLARNADRLAATASEIANETGATVVAVVADTTDDAQVARAVAEAVAGLGGGIDILVNAAAEPGGYAVPPPLADITGAFLQGEMDVKVMGYLRCAQAVVPYMQAQRWGRIVNLSGLAARQTGNTVGSIRNVAVAAMTRTGPRARPCGIHVPACTRARRAPSDDAWCGACAARARPICDRAAVGALHSICHLVDPAAVRTSRFLCRRNGPSWRSIAAGGGAPRSIHY